MNALRGFFRQKHVLDVLCGHQSHARIIGCNDSSVKLLQVMRKLKDVKLWKCQDAYPSPL